MKIIGHRGARALSPENTIASLEKAIEHGVDMVEIDVRVTKDGVAVLHHDPVLHDADGGEISIAHTTYAELLRHKADLAALDHAIRAVQHRCQIMIEVKPGVSVKQTVAIIRDRLSRYVREAEHAGFTTLQTQGIPPTPDLLERDPKYKVFQGVAIAQLMIFKKEI
jgi:glycerophosphoryl diester phosphodiesterase